MRDLDHLNDKQEAIKHLIQAMRNVAILTLVGLTIVLVTTLLWLLPFRFVVFLAVSFGPSLSMGHLRNVTHGQLIFRAGGITASKIYIRRSTPPCSRKSAVPGGIFGSLASPIGAQPTDLAEV
jgi:hypothetical protein